MYDGMGNSVVEIRYGAELVLNATYEDGHKQKGAGEEWGLIP